MDPPIRIRLWIKGKYKHWNSDIKGLQLSFKDLQKRSGYVIEKNYDLHVKQWLTIPFSRQKGRTTGAKIIVFSEVSGSVEHCQYKVLTYIAYRAVSGVFRTIDPTPPLHPASVSSQRTKGGGTHLPGGEGVGGQYFGRRQTLDWPLTVKSLYDWQ